MHGISKHVNKVCTKDATGYAKIKMFGYIS